MQILPFENLACPIDFEPLHGRVNPENGARSYICSRGHTFDAARQGYVNLLPSQFKHSKNPGDKKEMVNARTAFLESGSYEPVLQALFETVHSYMSAAGKKCYTVIDAGCGEGYYTAKLAQKLMNDPVCADVGFLGYDISKEAVSAAAKRSKDISWAVATTARMPVLTHGADIVLCLFGFPVWAEFARVLRSGGCVVLIDAGPAHLIELRRMIYDTVFEKEKSMRLHSGFDCIDSRGYRFRLKNLSGMQVENLLKMTPHYYRMQKEKQQGVLANPPMQLTLDFCVSVYAPSKKTNG